MMPRHSTLGRPASLARGLIWPAVLSLLALATPRSQAEVIDITWSASGRFEHAEPIAPGRFSEVCGRLQKGQAIRWRFEADQALDFNIHFHAGSQVSYPARANQVRRQEGVLTAKTAQDYCWMWSNKGGSEAQLKLGLQRQ